MKLKSLSLFLCLLIGTIEGVSQTRKQTNGRPVNAIQWQKAHFVKGVLPPFSFDYGGKPSRQFIRNWRYTATQVKADDANEQRYLYTYTEPTGGLKVECEVKTFADFNAVEWVLRFHNMGKANSQEIANVKACDVTLAYKGEKTFNLHYAEGSHAAKSDFSPQLKQLTSGEHFYMRPEGGRSSQMLMPFFNIEAPTARQGVMVAIGWTGTWYADTRQLDAHRINLATGIERLKTYLYPQEQIRTSSIALLFWKGENRFVGHNRFRRFLLAHHSRKINGQTATYPVSTGFNYGDPSPCNEYTCLTTDYALAMMRRYKQFKIMPENFWLDAGWYKHSADVEHHKNWANTVGNWAIDSLRFPAGFRPIADEAHRLGTKFMLWFEPERVMKGSAWAVQHPQWMLDARGSSNQEDWTKDGEHDSFLFNLGNPEACRWMSRYIGDFIEQNGIDYYRQDFNIEPEGFWYANDKPGRQGICEIHYIEGLYAFWDYLLQRFPHLLIDNCASGGRRLDLETTSRSAPLWRTDYHYGEPVGYQCHTYGLNLYLPLHATGTLETDRFTFRSSLGAAIIYNWKITDARQSVYEMRRCQQEFEALRPYFLEDYYPLSGNADITSEAIWLAYQLLRPTDNTGYVVAFRRKDNPSPTYTVQLQGLNPQMLYTLTNVDTGERVSRTGSQLSAGHVLTLDQPRSSLILRIEAGGRRP